MPVKKGVLTPEQIVQVETLSAVLTQAQIGDYLGISERTFRQRMWDDPDVAAAYSRGRAKTIGSVAKNLVMQAIDGDVNAQKFYLLSQAGWRVTQTHEVSGPEGGPVQFAELTNEELEERLAKTKNRVAAFTAAGLGENGTNGSNNGTKVPTTSE